MRSPLWFAMLNLSNVADRFVPPRNAIAVPADAIVPPPVAWTEAPEPSSATAVEEAFAVWSLSAPFTVIDPPEPLLAEFAGQKADRSCAGRRDCGGGESHFRSRTIGDDSVRAKAARLGNPARRRNAHCAGRGHVSAIRSHHAARAGSECRHGTAARKRYDAGSVSYEAPAGDVRYDTIRASSARHDGHRTAGGNRSAAGGVKPEGIVACCRDRYSAQERNRGTGPYAETPYGEAV